MSSSPLEMLDMKYAVLSDQLDDGLLVRWGSPTQCPCIHLCAKWKFSYLAINTSFLDTCLSLHQLHVVHSIHLVCSFVHVCVCVLSFGGGGGGVVR